MEDDASDNSIPVQDTTQLKDVAEAGNSSEAAEEPGVGLEAESTNVPSQMEGEAQADLGVNGTINEAGPATTPAAEEPARNPLLLLLQKCKAVIAGHKQKKLDKILEFAKQKNKIENKDIQKLLRVSPASANRYLDELVRNGKLKRSGEVGHAVFYESLISSI